MENFEALQNIDEFCRVLVKKRTTEIPKRCNAGENEAIDETLIEENRLDAHSSLGYTMQQDLEEPLVDIFDEGDHVRILVQCRCREQQVTFHPGKHGIVICREECSGQKEGPEMCRNVCSRLALRTDELQLDNMLFVIAKCNNNNTLEAMIPKLKQ